MNRRFLGLPLAIALLSTTGAVYSQQTGQAAATPQRYTSSIYVKVPSAKQGAFIAFYKTGAGAKVVRARMKADPNLTSWSLRQVIFPGETGSEANFVIVSASNGIQATPDPAKRDELYRAASGMDYASYMQTVSGMSEQVGSTLAHIHHITDGYALAEGDIMISSRFKVAAGRSTELNALAKDIQFPLAAERVKTGGIVKGWAYGHLTLPRGNSLPWDTTITMIYKNLADAVATNNGGGAAAAFAKMFPTKNYLNYMDSLREISKLVKSDTYRVVVSIRP